MVGLLLLLFFAGVGGLKRTGFGGIHQQSALSGSVNEISNQRKKHFGGISSTVSADWTSE
jgi:hypothetical protein